MLAIEITLPVLPLLLAVAAAFIIGFWLRSAQLRSCRKKILELEKEMLSNHADILELQRERANMLRHMKESKIPVIPMNKNKEDNDKGRQAK